MKASDSSDSDPLRPWLCWTPLEDAPCSYAYGSSYALPSLVGWRPSLVGWPSLYIEEKEQKDNPSSQNYIFRFC